MKLLAKPKQCHNCASDEIVCRPSTKTKGAWLWECKDCKARASADPETKLPRAYMADEATRAFRHALHVAVDTIAKDGFQGHVKTFNWLSMKLGCEDLQIGLLSKEQLKLCIELTHERYRELSRIAERRAEKRKLKFHQDCKNETRFVERRKRMKKPRR